MLDEMTTIKMSTMTMEMTMLDEMTTITRLMMTMLTMMMVMSMLLISLLLFLQDPFVELNDMQVTYAGLLRPNAPKLNATLDATVRPPDSL